MNAFRLERCECVVFELCWPSVAATADRAVDRSLPPCQPNVAARCMIFPLSAYTQMDLGSRLTLPHRPLFVILERAILDVIRAAIVLLEMLPVSA